MTKDELIAHTTAPDPEPAQDLAPTKENAKKLGMTKEELIAHTTAPDGPPVPGAPGSPYPANPKLLDPRPEDDWNKSIGKSALTVAARAAGHVPGIVGDIREGINLGAAGLESGVNQIAGAVGLPQTENADKGWRDIYEQRQKEWSPWWQKFPTGEDIYQGYVRPYVGQYDPVSPGVGGQLGRMGQAAFEAVITPNPRSASKLLTGGLTAKNALMHQAGQAASGAVAQGVGEATGNPFAAMAAGVGIPATTLGTIEAVRTRGLGRENAAKDAAANVIREQNATLEAPANLPGFYPRTPDLAKSRTVSALDQKLGVNGEGSDLKLNNKEVVTREINDQQRTIGDTAEANRKAGLNGVTPATKGEVSDRTQRFVDTLINNDKTKERSLWDDWRQNGAGIFHRKADADLKSYFDSLPEGDAKRTMRQIFDDARANLSRSRPIQSVVDKNGKTIQKPGPVADPSALQDARSALLTKARDATDTNEARQYGAAANQIRDIITDEGRYRFGATAPRDKWQTAVDATRKFHDDWGTKFARNTVDPELAPEALLTRTFTGRDAPLRTKEMMAAVGGDMNRINEFHDWHIANATGGGSPINPKAVDDYIVKNYDVIKQVPGLEQKLRDYGNLNADQQLMHSWNTTSSKDPKGFIKFVDQNRAQIDALATKQGIKPQFDEVEKAARQLDALVKPGAPNGKATEALLNNGRLGTILYGTTLPGKIGAIAGGVLGTIASSHFLPGGALVEAGMGALGAPIGRHIAHAADQIVSGGIRERAKEILRDAMNDPEKWELLRQKPTRESVQKLFGGVTSQATGAAVGTHEGVINHDPSE